MPLYNIVLLARKLREGGVDAALADAPGRGRRPEITEADELWAVEKACVPPKECGHAAKQWYPALLTRHVRSVAVAEGHPKMATVSETRLRKVMRDARVRPWRVAYYCERRDEEFGSKAHEVFVVYKQLSLCLDDAGDVWAECVDAEGRAARTSAETQAYLNTVPGRFTFVFVPKHASWLNLVESFFGRMSRQMLRGIRVSSAEELERRIYDWLDEFNEDPTPYRWTWGLDGVDMEDEDPASIGYQVVNAKARRPEDAGKPAPPRPRRAARKKSTSI